MREKIDVGEEGQLDGRRGGELAYVNYSTISKHQQHCR
jgi:hypothetical protein